MLLHFPVNSIQTNSKNYYFHIQMTSTNHKSLFFELVMSPQHGWSSPSAHPPARQLRRRSSCVIIIFVVVIDIRPRLHRQPRRRGPEHLLLPPLPPRRCRRRGAAALLGRALLLVALLPPPAGIERSEDVGRPQPVVLAAAGHRHRSPRSSAVIRAEPRRRSVEVIGEWVDRRWWCMYVCRIWTCTSFTFSCH